ncbi:MAG TPA: hypothetical protein VNO22_01410 [Planctomycetota bacterium]|nr:hypothetical protein [Planctomycetota bacterium]
MPTPRPGRASHHGVMSAWMESQYAGYLADKAPAILMPTEKHLATYGVYNRWRVERTRKMGTFDWKRITEADIRALSQQMFQAAGVPAEIQAEYWRRVERMKAALQKP